MSTTTHRRTIVVAPDSFKGSLPATDVARALARGLREVMGHDIDIIECPLGDGGEDTLDPFIQSRTIIERHLSVQDAIGRPRPARYGLTPDGRTAIIEAAQAYGLPHVADRAPTPLRADSHGVGQLARDALDHGVDEILLFIGGSAGTDGGTGMLRALGTRFLDPTGQEVAPGGAGLSDITTIDLTGLHIRARSVRWQVAVDVTNPLCGTEGAAAVYGPQKGATPDQVAVLDHGLDHFAQVLHDVTGLDVGHAHGAGAAGGMPAALCALLGAELTSGFDIIADLVDLDTKCARADLVLTGEGCLDTQSLQGKVVHGVLSRTPPHTPVVVVAGTIRLSPTEIRAAGITAAFSIAPGPAALPDLLEAAAPLIGHTASHIGALVHSQWTTGQHCEPPARLRTDHQREPRR